MLRALFTGRGLIATLAVLVGVAMLCRLGIWQLDRHNQRMAQNQLIEARMTMPPVSIDAAPADDLDYRHVTVRGVFDPSQEILLRNREYGGATGYHILTPLRMADGRAVLVDRGWVPLDAQDPERRMLYAAPAGEVAIDGVARRSQSDIGGPEDPPTGPLMPRLDAWFRVDIGRIQQQTGYPLLPVFVEQQPAPDDPKQPPLRLRTEGLGLGSHLGYSIQWFAFAIILAVGYVVLVRRQLRGPKRAAQPPGVQEPQAAE